MQKKNENFLDKIVKKDYNNELETILEKKYFDENVKSILLSTLYKIEAAYKDYKQVKQNADTKEEFIEKIIQIIQKDCNEIKLIKPNSQENKIIGNKTFLVEKNKKRIICYNVERKLLYCISKISKKQKIIKDDYFLINETLSNLINVGNNINTVEPLRDFNGYSWTIIPREIESIEHNLIYQNLLILVGNKFLTNWIENKEFIIDYMEIFRNKFCDEYGKENAVNFINVLYNISILIDIKFNKKSKEKMLKLYQDVKQQLENIEDNKKFIEEITKEKRKLTKEIRKIDETINDKSLLQEEYIKRNELLPLKEKIFSIRILRNLMVKERKEKIEKINELNEFLKPKKFVEYKKELENKLNYLKLVNIKDLQQEIDKLNIELQRIFLKCFETKLEKIRKQTRIY